MQNTLMAFGTWLVVFLLPTSPLVGIFRGTWSWRLALAAFVGMALLAVEYSFLGLVFGLQITRTHTLGFCLMNLVLSRLLGYFIKTPVMDGTAAMREGHWPLNLFVGLTTLGVFIVCLPSFLDRTPAISDNLGRFNFVISLQQGGIPPHHWLQEQALTQYYFYYFVPIAAYQELINHYWDIPRTYSLYIILQTLVINLLLATLIRRVSRNALVNMLVMVLVTYGSSFSFLPALATKLLFHLNWAQSMMLWAEKLGWKSGIYIVQPVMRCLWIPHDYSALAALVLAITVHFGVWGQQVRWNFALVVLLLIYAFGAQTYFLPPFVAGVGAWLIRCLLKKEWQEWRSWSTIGALTCAISLPYLFFLSSRSGVVSLGLPRLDLSASHLSPILRQILGILLGTIAYLIYVLVEYGWVTVLVYYLWRGRKQGSSPALSEFIWCFSLASIGFLALVNFHGVRNDLTARGLSLAATLLACGYLLMDPQFPRLKPRSWLVPALWIFSLLPPTISLLGMLHFCRVVPKIDQVTLWANRNLPANALVLMDESLFAVAAQNDLEKDYQRSVYELIERRRWLKLSRIHPADLGVVDQTLCLEDMPGEIRDYRPQYVLANPADYVGDPGKEDVVYRDDHYLLIQRK